MSLSLYFILKILWLTKQVNLLYWSLAFLGWILRVVGYFFMLIFRDCCFFSLCVDIPILILMNLLYKFYFFFNKFLWIINIFYVLWVQSSQIAELRLILIYIIWYLIDKRPVNYQKKLLPQSFSSYFIFIYKPYQIHLNILNKMNCVI